MIDIGIDPGLHGAIAAVDHRGRLIGIHDMPTVPMEWAGMGDRRAHLVGLVRILRELAPVTEPVRIWIERVGIQRSAGNAIQSVGSLCATVGIILGACEALPRAKVAGVGAAEWTKHYGLRRMHGETGAAWKSRHRAMALTLHPDAPITLARHDGRADALMVAMFGRDVVGG